MNLQQRINGFTKLGEWLRFGLDHKEEELENCIIKAKVHNPWFDPRFTHYALESIADLLQQKGLGQWVGEYPKGYFEDSQRVIGVIMAGNIPLVGFHDFLSVLITGNTFKGKLSSSDEFLLPFLANKLIEFENGFQSKIIFESHLLKDFDAVIATGSNNSARYFDYYFGKYPHIIRRNRNSVAILQGQESLEQLQQLAEDVFLYFGLGCRSVSKIFVPQGYDLTKLLDAFQPHVILHQHTKYFNNYEYNKSIFLLNKTPHLDNGFCLVTKEVGYASPVSVLYYEEYIELAQLENRLETDKDQIQCIVGGEGIQIVHENFGGSQQPGLSEYADNVDVISFLGTLK